MLSMCGFGCYRIDDGIPQHQKALEKALLSGINVIDTSSNYSDGGSEILVGKVLNKLISENKINREMKLLLFLKVDIYKDQILSLEWNEKNPVDHLMMS